MGCDRRDGRSHDAGVERVRRGWRQYRPHTDSNASLLHADRDRDIRVSYSVDCVDVDSGVSLGRREFNSCRGYASRHRARARHGAFGSGQGQA